MVNSLPLNIFTAIIAPLIIPFIEQTLAKSIASDNSYKINRLYGKKQKKADDSYKYMKNID